MIIKKTDHSEWMPSTRDPKKEVMFLNAEVEVTITVAMSWIYEKGKKNPHMLKPKFNVGNALKGALEQVIKSEKSKK